MKIKRFTNLHLDEKTNYLWDYGVCLNQRLVDNSHIVCIFSLDDFFVEAIYSKNNNRVDSISPVDLRNWEAYVDLTLHEMLNPS